MIYIDLQRARTIEFDIQNADLIESVQMVVNLPDKRVLNFPANIFSIKDDNSGILIVEIPALDKEVSNGIVADCYMEVKDKNGVFHKLEQTQITFQSEKVLSLQFHDVPSARKPEISSTKKDAILGAGVVLVPVLQRKPRKIVPRTKVIEGEFFDTGSDN